MSELLLCFGIPIGILGLYLLITGVYIAFS
jgi:hypothetical protein